MNTPTVPKQKAPITRFIPKLNQHIGVVWLWGPIPGKKLTAGAAEPLLEVFPTPNVAETLHSMRSNTSGPRRYATHVAFEPFESFDEAKEYASQAVTLFEPAEQVRHHKAEPSHQNDADKVL